MTRPPTRRRSSETERPLLPERDLDLQRLRRIDRTSSERSALTFAPSPPVRTGVALAFPSISHLHTLSGVGWGVARRTHPRSNVAGITPPPRIALPRYPGKRFLRRLPPLAVLDGTSPHGRGPGRYRWARSTSAAQKLFIFQRRASLVLAHSTRGLQPWMGVRGSRRTPASAVSISRPRRCLPRSRDSSVPLTLPANGSALQRHPRAEPDRDRTSRWAAPQHRCERLRGSSGWGDRIS